MAKVIHNVINKNAYCAVIHGLFNGYDDITWKISYVRIRMKTYFKIRYAENMVLVIIIIVRSYL